MIKKSISLSLILFLFLLLPQNIVLSQTFTPPETVDNPASSERMIIKFKSDGQHAVTESVAAVYNENKTLQQSLPCHCKSLDILNKSCGLQKVKGLFVRHDGSPLHRLKENLIEQVEDAANKKVTAAAEKESSELADVYVFSFPKNQNIQEICDRYKKDPHVAYAHPDFLMQASALPNDPLFYGIGAWGLRQIGGLTAWDVTQGDGVTVAVVDTGIALQHPDLKNQIWENPFELVNGRDDDGNGLIDDVHGWDFFAEDNNPEDENGHGTHIAGIIAAEGNNQTGLLGIAPEAKIMPLRGLSPTGSGYISDLANAIVYATLHGAKVINNSWGSPNGILSMPALEEAIRIAYGLGATIFFASGNSAMNIGKTSPLFMNEVIVVGSSTTTDTRSLFSSFGLPVSLVAPGETILSTWIGNDYSYKSGTSMATPFAAGVAALLLSKNPQLTNANIKQILRASATQPENFNAGVGSGRLDAAKALTIQNPLEVKLTSPTPFTSIAKNKTLQITGTATGNAPLRYQLWIAKDAAAPQWSPLQSEVSTPVTNGVLLSLDLSAFQPGNYVIRLTAKNEAGNLFQDVTAITIVQVTIPVIPKIPTIPKVVTVPKIPTIPTVPSVSKVLNLSPIARRILGL